VRAIYCSQLKPKGIGKNQKRRRITDAVSESNLNYLTAAFSLLPAETFTVFAAAIWMVAPV
jgi:hypothetical protein